MRIRNSEQLKQAKVRLRVAAVAWAAAGDRDFKAIDRRLLRAAQAYVKACHAK